MKRIFLLAVICLTGAQSLVAQRFIHGVGGGAFNEETNTTKEKGGFSWTYAPRYSFAERERTSLSVGIPLIVGVSGIFDRTMERDPGYKEDKLTYTLVVPLMFNFNFGAGSAGNCKNRWGFFAGAGYAYYLGNAYERLIDPDNNEYTDLRTKSATGPAGNFGVRYAIGRQKRYNVELRLLFIKSITSYKPGFFDVCYVFNF